MKRDLRVLSLGAGVQSSTVLLMMGSGEIEPADVAIFADTGWEPAAVYEWLEFLEGITPIEIVKVSGGDIRSDALDPSKRFASMPLYIKNPDGSPGISRRQCTNEYKIGPITAEIRDRVGGNLRGKTVQQVVGISLDEVRRMRDSKAKWQHFDYPLVDLRMTRHDCKLWMVDNGYPEPPRSACVGCPFRSDDTWRDLSDSEFADAVAFDAAIRKGYPKATEARQELLGNAYLHQKRIPLSEVNLATVEDHGQMALDGWDAECEGMCGV